MPFGLKNAPATFQRLMQRVLGDLHLKGCVVYIDDIIIYTKIEEELEQMLKKVFQRIYHRFIQDYAKVAHPLTELLRGCNPRQSKRKKIVCTDWT